MNPDLTTKPKLYPLHLTDLGGTAVYNCWAAMH